MPGVESSTSGWFNCLRTRPGATYRLICFPWCGGGSQYFARWGTEFPDNIEVVGIRLPGREGRSKESLISDLNRIVRQIGEQIARSYGDKPFAFFGHSMGTILAYEVAVYLKEKHEKEPVHLFVSSEYAPHSKLRRDRVTHPDYKPLHEYTNSELIQRIAKLGGTPQTFLDNADFMVNTFLPPYRNDLKMVARYTRTLSGGRKPLSCPITAFDGDRDTSHHLCDFADLTTNRFQEKKFPGGHFYLLKEDNAKRIRDVITTSLS